MSTLSIALIIVIATVCIPLIFILINRKNRKKKNKAFLNTFMEEASKQGLSFSSQEILRSKIIGLDSVKQTLLVFDFNNDDNIKCIKMSEVKSCSVEKNHDSIDIGTKRQAKTESHLRSIDLKFIFKNGAGPVSVSFYDSSINSIYEMAELESKAKTWEVLISKMLFKESKARA
jgi:hypothetical protein